MAAPTLTSLSLPSVVDISAGVASLTATVGATEQGGTVDFVNISLDRPYRDSFLGDWSSLQVGTRSDDFSDGTSTVTQNILPTTNVGLYTISSVQLFDSANHLTVYRTDDLRALGFATSFSVVNGPDRIPPDVSITSTGGLVGHDARTLTGTIDAADAGQTITIVDTATSYGTTTRSVLGTTVAAGASGTWSWSLALLGDGVHVVSAQATDTTGNTGYSNQVSYTLDTSAPSITLSGIGSLQRSPVQTLTGTIDTADAGLPISILDGTTVIGTGMADSFGHWSATVTLSGDGLHTLVATATDSAGNTGRSFSSLSDTLDTSPPVVAITSAGSATKSSTQTVTGTIDLADAGRPVTIYEGAAPVGFATSRMDGTWSASVTLFGDGLHTFVAHATDFAGNTGVSGTVVYALDMTAPSLAFISAGGLVRQADQTLTGTIGLPDAGLPITLRDGSNVLGTVASDAAGHWSATVTLSDGRHDLTAQATDAIGNIGSSFPLTYTVDTVGPVVAITSAGSATKSSTQTVTGTIDLADAGSLVTIYEGATSVGFATSRMDGTWSASVTLFGDGLHTFAAHATDIAGNTGVSGTVVYTLDMTAPSLAFTNTGGLVRQADQTLTGTIGLPDAGLPITLRDGATVLGTVASDAAGHWSTTVTLSDGRHDLTAQATDAIGNIGSTFPLTYTVDTVAPVVAITDGGSSSGSIWQTVSGTVDAADAGRLVMISDATGTLGLAVPATSGTWSTTVALTNAGPHTVTASVTDAAGNVGVSAPLTIIAQPSTEMLAFGTVTHDGHSAGGEVYALYDGLLGRAPDTPGLEFWADAFSDGVAPKTLAAGFLASAEGQARAGAADDATFVTQLYQATLHRNPDAAGLADWTDQLAHGTSRADVGVGFALSSEHLANIQPALDAGLFVPDADASAVARVYYTMLSRAPDAAGLKFWTDAIKSGTPLTAETQTFLNSPEAQAKVAGLSTGQYVDLVYTNALGRHAEADGLAFWTNAIDGHSASRVDVTTQIGQSTEAQTHLAPLIEQGWHLA